MRRLRAKWYGRWLHIWDHDDPYRLDDDEQGEYFNRRTGEPVYVMRGDDTKMAVIRAGGDEWEVIPPLTHGAHHKIFAQWLATLSDEVHGLCNPKSIGGFFHDYSFHFPEGAREAREDWQAFHDAALRKTAEEWLQKRGWAVDWSD